MIIDNVVTILAGLGGLGALVSMLVNALKKINVVKDGTSEQWIQGVNLLAFVGVAITYLFNIPIDWGAVNVIIGSLVGLFGAVLQLLASKGTYAVTKGMPVIGYSYSTSKSEDRYFPY